METSIEDPEKREVFADLCRRYGTDEGRMSKVFLSTGIPAADMKLQGGWRRETCYEVVETRTSAGASLLVELCLQAARRARAFAVLVDGFDSFAPETVDPGVLEHLFWVRCGDVDKVLNAADMLSRDSNFLFHLVDLRWNSRAEVARVPATKWYRLQRSARRSGQVLVVFSSFPCVVSATVRFQVEGVFGIDALERGRSDLVEGLKLESRRVIARQGS